MKRRGADFLIGALQEAGVEHVFTLSGNHIMAVFDAALESSLKLIHVRHEAAAVHMADATARLTGNPGIALVTAGPGHANAISALYTAACSESPVILLSGRAARDEFGRGAFQEMEQTELARPVTKASWTVQSTDVLCDDVAKAIRIARSGRPGPVHLSLPSDLLERDIGAASIARLQSSALGESESRISEMEIQQAVGAFRIADRPLVVCGPSAAVPRARNVRDNFIRNTSVPVVALESPRGVNDPSMGRLVGILASADAVLLLGKRLDFMLRFGDAFAKGCRKVTVENVDTIASLASLESAIGLESKWCHWRRQVEEEISYRPSEWKQRLTLERQPIHPIDLCREVQGVLDSDVDSVLICDGGEFGQWAQAGLKAGTRLINGPAGAIGAALPFAVGARLALGNEGPIVAMMGDGTFGFHMAEFDTACRYGTPLLAVIGNDQCWNAEYQIQLRTYGKERARGCELRPIRYDRVVEDLGGHGEYVEKLDDLRPALERALRSGRPSCVNVMIDRVAAPSFGAARQTASDIARP